MYLLSVIFCFCFFFFFKQKTAYEMRISDWSSDVCSSDLATRPLLRCKWNIMNSGDLGFLKAVLYNNDGPGLDLAGDGQWLQMVIPPKDQIGRASCRERVCQYV